MRFEVGLLTHWQELGALIQVSQFDLLRDAGRLLHKKTLRGRQSRDVTDVVNVEELKQ